MPHHVRDPVNSSKEGVPAGVPFADCVGRLVEFSAPHGPGALLTAAVALVRDAQRAGETTAWVTPAASGFYPPDVERAGVDLAALAVLRVPTPGDVARSATRLLRAGAFGLVVLDLTDELGGTHGRPRELRLPPALLSRLAGLARTHDAVALALTTKPAHAASLGPLVSLRAEVRRAGAGDTLPSSRTPGETGSCALALVTVEIEVLRDRKDPRFRTLRFAARAPEGLLP